MIECEDIFGCICARSFHGVGVVVRSPVQVFSAVCQFTGPCLVVCCVCVCAFFQWCVANFGGGVVCGSGCGVREASNNRRLRGVSWSRSEPIWVVNKVSLLMPNGEHLLSLWKAGACGGSQKKLNVSECLKKLREICGKQLKRCSIEVAFMRRRLSLQEVRRVEVFSHYAACSGADTSQGGCSQWH